MPEITIDARTLGPLFDARGDAAVQEFIREATDAISAQARSEVMETLNRRIRNPTPYYETQIVRQRLSADEFRVHDRDVVYGPWLEGTGERNRTTRFKGYAAFRKAARAINDRLPQLTAYALRRCIDRLNGGV